MCKASFPQMPLDKISPFNIYLPIAVGNALYVPLWYIVIVLREAVLISECLFHTSVKYFEHHFCCLEKTYGLGVTSANVSADAMEVNFKRKKTNDVQ